MDAESIIREASVAVGAFGWVFSPFVSIFSILSIFTFCAMMILCFLGHFNNLWAFVRHFWEGFWSLVYILSLVRLLSFWMRHCILHRTLPPPETYWQRFSQDGWLKFARLPVRGSHSSHSENEIWIPPPLRRGSLDSVNPADASCQDSPGCILNRTGKPFHKLEAGSLNSDRP